MFYALETFTPNTSSTFKKNAISSKLGSYVILIFDLHMEMPSAVCQLFDYAVVLADITISLVNF
jgi:hypothetical protein